MIRFHACLLAGLVAFAPSTPAAPTVPGDIERGEDLAYTCTGCHGIPAYMNVYPTFHVPKLGGQNYDYLVSALEAYRAGTREHPTMQAQAGSMSDEDIVDVASYFVSVVDRAGKAPQPGGRPPRSVPEAKLATCTGCHGEDGVGVDPSYPKLAGQYADYMLHALKAYRSGDRQNAVMGGIVTVLSEAEMKALAAHYAAKEGLVDLEID